MSNTRKLLRAIVETAVTLADGLASALLLLPLS